MLNTVMSLIADHPTYFYIIGFCFIAYGGMGALVCLDTDQGEPMVAPTRVLGFLVAQPNEELFFPFMVVTGSIVSLLPHM